MAEPARVPETLAAEKLWSVTTLLKEAMGTSRPLVDWNVRTVAEAAYDRLGTLKAYHEDGDREGAVKWLKDARWQRTGEAMARGTEVHAAAEAYNLGREPEVSEATRPLVEQYRQFLVDFEPRFIAAEAPVYNRSFSYAGTLDAIAVIQGEPVVLDIKTTMHGPRSERSRPPYPETALQLCFYRRAEWIGILAERHEEARWRRYYLLGAEQHLEPMPEVTGAMCLVISPEDYLLVPVATDMRTWHYCTAVLELARWGLEVSKLVVGQPVRP